MTHGEIGLRTLDDIFDMNTSLATDTQLLPQEHFLMPIAESEAEPEAEPEAEATEAEATEAEAPEAEAPEAEAPEAEAEPEAEPEAFLTINGPSIEGTTNSTFAASSLSLTLHEVVKRWELF